jgi:DNA-binding response OmpR family regulator
MSVLESVRVAAEKSGVDLDTAATWEEGIAIFQALSPDLVIADYNLPGSRHGLRLLAEVKALRPTVRVILVSGYLSEEDMAAVNELNLVDRALVKSVATNRALLEEINAAARLAATPTDWVRVAQAHVASEGVSEEALDDLDAHLTGSAEARGAPGPKSEE